MGKSEIMAQQNAGECLHQERASLRAAAVGLGQELQNCVCTSDELVSENLHMRTEVAALESDNLKFRKGQELSCDFKLQEAQALCESLQTHLHVKHEVSEEEQTSKRRMKSAQFGDSDVAICTPRTSAVKWLTGLKAELERVSCQTLRENSIPVGGIHSDTLHCDFHKGPAQPGGHCSALMQNDSVVGVAQCEREEERRLLVERLGQQDQQLQLLQEAVKRFATKT